MISRVAVPPPVNPTRALMSPWAAIVPVAAAWLTVPLNSSVVPAAVRVVPAAITTVPPRNSTVLRVWEPVMVRLPANTTVEPVTFSPPGTALTVQLRAVRRIPVPGPGAARVRLPDGLLTSTAGSAPTRTVWYPVTVWLPLPLMSSVAVPPPVKPTWAAIDPWAASVPVFMVPLNRFRPAPTVTVVPAAIVIVPPRISTAFRVWEPVIVPPANETVLPATFSPPGAAV